MKESYEFEKKKIYENNNEFYQNEWNAKKKTSEKSNEKYKTINIIKFIKITKSTKISAQIISQFILKCRNCNKKFFSNNKFHRHIKIFHKTEKISQKILKITSINIIASIQIIDFTNKTKNYREFVFKSHRYAIVKNSLILKNAEQKFCMNSETFMSLINRTFLTKQLFHIIKHKTTFNIKIKDIKFAIHDNLKYVILNLYMSEKCQKNSATAYLKTEFHIVNEIKINMLIKMNVMKSERINLNFENKIMIISTCRDIQVSINFHRKKTSVNRTIRAAIQITMSIEKIIIVSMRIKNAQISKNRDYSFFFKNETHAKIEKKIFCLCHKSQFNSSADQKYFRQIIYHFKKFQNWTFMWFRWKKLFYDFIWKQSFSGDFKSNHER